MKTQAMKDLVDRVIELIDVELERHRKYNRKHPYTTKDLKLIIKKTPQKLN